MDRLRKDYPFEYEVIKADIDEKAIRHDTPTKLVLALAHAKADAIIAQLKQQQQQQQQEAAAAAGQPGSDVGLLITCDQVVVHEGQIREKPEDVAEAHR
jgi:septum formation protein